LHIHIPLSHIGHPSTLPSLSVARQNQYWRWLKDIIVALPFVLEADIWCLETVLTFMSVCGYVQMCVDWFNKEANAEELSLR